ncbi:MAG: hypothetical protein VX331_03320, partial [Candidatus Thermoplasmatota archaeon]|nr:hypothetical protein [Candidatus Thermoplasmatota archaeon]
STIRLKLCLHSWLKHLTLIFFTDFANIFYSCLLSLFLFYVMPFSTMLLLLLLSWEHRLATSWCLDKSYY